MKDFCAVIVCIVTLVSWLCYLYQIWARKAMPTTSTWIIFLVGCWLSFGTYLAAEEKDWKSGIMNTVDVFYVTGTLIAILLWTDRKVRFKPFEKWYLAGVGAIVAYGIMTGNAWGSNVLTQILLSIAYLPMFHKLIAEKRKTDSYFAWVPPAFTAAVAMYPAIHQGNALAVMYSARAFIFTFSTVLLMLYYQVKAAGSASSAK
jgi:hypothetical protein